MGTEKKTPEKKEEVPKAAYEPGRPEAKTEGRWRQKVGDRKEKLKYLQTAERYFYAKEGFGSEKRKNPA
jgi:hypothetical protein